MEKLHRPRGKNREQEARTEANRKKRRAKHAFKHPNDTK